MRVAVCTRGLPRIGHSMSLALPALLACVLAACAKPVPDLPRLGPDALIVAFGDSVTFGTGARPEESYPAVLEKLTGRTVVNAGRSGEMSSEGLRRLPEVLDRERPALLVLCHGGNDMLRKGDPERLEANIRRMVLEARGRGVPVVLVGVPAPGLFPKSADLYQRIADDFDLPYEDEILPTVESEGSLKSDAIHPNRDGYRKIAEAIHRLLRVAGAV